MYSPSVKTTKGISPAITINNNLLLDDGASFTLGLFCLLIEKIPAIFLLQQNLFIYDPYMNPYCFIFAGQFRMVL